MPRPLLPPRGISAPTQLLYDKALPPVVRDTWLRLRGLAWGREETPALSMDQISELLGMSRSTLYGHMLLLRDRAALQWRAAGSKTLIVSFAGCVYDLSENLDKPSPSGMPLDSTIPNQEKTVVGSLEGGRPVQKSGRSKAPKGPVPPAVAAFHAVSKRFPDEAVWPQIVQIVGQESEKLDQWSETVRGWIAAGYRKENIEGLLDWFKQGRTSKGGPNPSHAPNGAGAAPEPKGQAAIRAYAQKRGLETNGH